MATRKFRMVSAQASGIGGWLLVFVLSQVLSIGLLAWYIPNTIAVLGQAGSEGSLALGVVLALQIVRMLAFIIGLILIFRRDRRTPRFYQIVLLVVGAIWAFEMLGDLSAVRGVIYCIGWFFYWRGSERVRLTFTPGPGMTEIPKTS